MTSFTGFAKAGLVVLAMSALAACGQSGDQGDDKPGSTTKVTSSKTTDDGTAITSALTINSPWVRAAQPPAKTSAGYMVITNEGSQADTLLSVSAPFAEISELHQSLTEDGVSMMRRIRGLEIPAGGSVTLEPGSYHLMFINLTSAVDDGTNATFTLEFEKAGKVDITAPVKAGNSGHEGRH